MCVRARTTMLTNSRPRFWPALSHCWPGLMPQVYHQGQFLSGYRSLVGFHVPTPRLAVSDVELGVTGGVVGGEVGGLVGGEVGGEVGRLVGGLVGGEVGGEVGRLVGGLVGGEVGGEVGRLVGGLVGGEVGGEVGRLVGGDVGGDVGGEVGGLVGGTVGPLVGGGGVPLYTTVKVHWLSCVVLGSAGLNVMTPVVPSIVPQLIRLLACAWASGCAFICTRSSAAVPSASRVSTAASARSAAMVASVCTGPPPTPWDSAPLGCPVTASHAALCPLRPRRAANYARLRRSHNGGCASILNFEC